MGKNYFEVLFQLVNLKSFQQNTKKREQDFTRNRKMTFTRLVYFMLSMVKQSTQNALNAVRNSLSTRGLPYRR